MLIWSDREFVDNLIIKPFEVVKEVFKGFLMMFEPKHEPVCYRRVLKPKAKRFKAQPAISQGSGKSVPNRIPAYQADDLDSYEYASDGKRMCFINYTNGHTVYHEDHLFHVLKKKMLFDL
jgi:hypothetical protein